MPNGRYVYDFDHGHERPPRELADLLGGKGANLAEMTSVLQLPVPPGFTISTEACRAYLSGGWPDGLSAELEAALHRLELRTGRLLADPTNPLLLAVRSGARFSMPGMMDTVLNLGLNDETVAALARRTEQRFALDSYRRFIAMYARVVLAVPAELFETALADARRRCGVRADFELDTDALAEVVATSLQVVLNHSGAVVPSDPAQQLRGAIEAVFRSWGSPRARTYRRREVIAADLGTALNVQVMVFGNRDDRSATGVGFTRNPVTGSAEPYGDFLIRAQGEDIVAGISRPEPLAAMGMAFPAAYEELVGIFTRLERHYRDVLDTEFTIEQDKLWMLQARVGQRSGAAALRIAVAMAEDPHIALDRREALQRIRPEHVEQVLRRTLSGTGAVIATGLAASPGAAVGRVCLSADAAVQAAEQGHDVILVRAETSPEDVHGMAVARGLLTTRGGLVSHAAVVARGWGIPAVVGAQGLAIGEGMFTATVEGVTVVVREGTVIAIDGNSGVVMLDGSATVEPDPPAELALVLGWADEVRQGHLRVLANADTASDAAMARALGAQGVGLCRTEGHFQAERLPLLRRAMWATTDAQQAAALAELAARQRADFEELLLALDGLPLTVRLLDPPRQGFWPATEDSSDSTKAAFDLLRPRLYRMQAAALLDAVAARLALGGHPKAEIIIPTALDGEELVLLRQWVQREVSAAASRHGWDRWPAGILALGRMIETPPEVLRAAEVATGADFFCFDTQQLTELSLGVRREDLEARSGSTALETRRSVPNPFETIDVEVLGQLVSIGVTRGRGRKAEIGIGVWGEHGGDPASIAWLVAAGVNYVSCPLSRVPVARLAAAHAVLDLMGLVPNDPADR